MRRYLALQAMESGKSLGGSLLGRRAPYGGMLLNTDTSSSKVGMFAILTLFHLCPADWLQLSNISPVAP